MILKSSDDTERAFGPRTGMPNPWCCCKLCLSMPPSEGKLFCLSGQVEQKGGYDFNKTLTDL